MVITDRRLAVESEDTFETLQRLRVARAASTSGPPPSHYTSSADEGFGAHVLAGSPRDDGTGRRHASRLQTPPRDRSRERATPRHMKTTVSKLHKTVGNVHEPVLERALGTAQRMDERRRERNVLEAQIRAHSTERDARLARAHSSPRLSAGSEYGKLLSSATQGSLKRVSPMKQPTRHKAPPTAMERLYVASIKEKAEAHRSSGRADGMQPYASTSGTEALSESLRTVRHLAASLGSSNGLDWI